MTIMEKIRNDPHTWLNSFALIVQLLAIVFFGGAMWNMVQGHEVRIGKIENQGSSSMQRHEALDEERISGLKVRLTAVESAIVVFAEMKADIKVMQAKLDKLQSDLDSHQRMTTK